MRMKKRFWSGLVVVGAAILLAGEPVLAKANNQNGCEASGGNPQKCVDAPEIDAGMGGMAMALLVSAMLLVSEKRRRAS